MKVKAGSVLFAGYNCPEHIEAAKEYIKRNSLTGEDVKMESDKETQTELLVVTKKEVELLT